MISDIINDTLKDLRYIKLYKFTIFLFILFKLNYPFSFEYRIIFVLYFTLIINNIIKDRINKLNINEINQFNFIYVYFKNATFS